MGTLRKWPPSPFPSILRPLLLTRIFSEPHCYSLWKVSRLVFDFSANIHNKKLTCRLISEVILLMKCKYCY